VNRLRENGFAELYTGKQKERKFHIMKANLTMGLYGTAYYGR